MKRLFILCFFVCCYAAGFAQQATEYTWWNPVQDSTVFVEGQGWPKETKNPYDRLPSRVEKTVRPIVWSLSQQAAGLLIRFRASTDEIVVRYTVGKKEHALPHMPATGVSGLDLYAMNNDGGWQWCAGKYAFKDTLEYRFLNLERNDGYHDKGREYQLYLPLYNSVTWLEIGVPKNTYFQPIPVRQDKPIVIYGTSIAQGACASRPGMAWTAQLGRKLDRPVINLGFSGNGRLEKEIVDLLPELDAKLYVLDCLPNLVGSVVPPAEVKNRILYAVRTLRQKKPNTPILLAEHAGYTEDLTNPTRRKLYTDANLILQQAFAELKAEGLSQLYLIPKNEFRQDIETMVDGTHPSDLGMMRYAEGYEKAIRTILREPMGTITTTIPRRQYRDWKKYDWNQRHNALLQLKQTRTPGIVFIGNSITHFWGGQPEGPNKTGQDSWDAVLEPLGTVNFGFGWDRIENVLWRVYHDELDGFDARQVVLLLGTNNLEHNTDQEIIDGLKGLVQAIQVRQPRAKVLLLGLLPRRKQEPRIAKLNAELAKLAKQAQATYANPGRALLKAGGTIDEALFTDGLHPAAKGYRIIADQLKLHLVAPAGR